LSLSSYFLSPVQLRRGSDRVVLVGIWNLSRPNQDKGTYDFYSDFILPSHPPKKLKKGQKQIKDSFRLFD